MSLRPRLAWPGLFPLLALFLTACSGGRPNAAVSPTRVATSATIAAAPVATFVWASDGQPYTLARPAGVAADLQGNIFVCDCGHDRVVKFDAAGRALSAWGSAGSLDGQFHFSVSQPDGRCLCTGSLAVDRQGNVYVGDLTGRIQEFDTNGRFLQAWNEKTSDGARFSPPSGLAVDAQGNVYVADCRSNSVQVYDNHGRLLNTWGSKGTGNGQFQCAAGLALDGHGNVYVTDAGNNRIQKFDALGNFLYAFATPAADSGQFVRSQGIAIDAQDSIYVIDNRGHRVLKFDRFGKLLGAWGSAGSGEGQFSSAGGIATDSQGNAYLTDAAGRLEKFRLR